MHHEWERKKKKKKQWQAGVAERYCKFVKNKVCCGSGSLLNKGNLHMNIPAQLCCHLLGPTVAISTLGYLPQREGGGHSDAFSVFSSVSPQLDCELLRLNLNFTNIPLLEQWGQPQSSKQRPSWLSSLPRWYLQLSAVFSGVIFQHTEGREGAREGGETPVVY